MLGSSVSFRMRHWFATPLLALSCVAPAAAQSPITPASSALHSEGREETSVPEGPTDGREHTAADRPALPDQSGDGATDQVGQLIPAAPPTTPAAPPVSSLVTGLRADFAGVRTADNVMVMLAAGAAAGIVHPYDAAITEHFSSSPSLTAFFAPGKIVGGFAVQFGGAIATYALGRAGGHGRAAVVGADLVRAQLVTQTFTQALKLSLNRARPDGDNWSLPSGHSSGTFASATVLHQHFGWKAGLPAYAVAAYVAASRLAEDRHYASDVIVGAGIGIISARAVTIGRGPTRFALAPMPVPGGRGAGISFTRLAD